MAIPINKYVSISSYLPSSGRASASHFNCLLITPEDMVTSEDTKIKAIVDAYNAGEIVQPSKELASGLFNATTDTAKFINGYEAYVSPSNNTTTDLMLFKMTAEDGGSPFAAFLRANSKAVAFTGITFLAPNGSDESTAGSGWYEDLAEVAAGLGNGRILVINYKADGNPQNAVDAAAIIRANTPVIMMYGAKEWSGYAPLAMIGSTVFSASYSSSFMYRLLADEAAVVDNTTAQLLDANFINYIGQTQSNGQKLEFYQRGYNLDGTDTAIFLNEMWFRSACESALINRLAGGLPIPYSSIGVTMVENLITDIANTAKNNGIFLQMNLSDKQIAEVQEFFARADEEISAEAISYAMNVDGFYVLAYQSQSDSGEPSIAYIVAYGSGASVKFIQGVDFAIL